MGKMIVKTFLILTVKIYAVRGCVIVVKQLEFQIYCKFRKYMRKKPEKYELKLFLFCNYLIGMPYIGH